MTENIITGKFYRILTDVTNDVWDRLSFWRKASDIEFDDGTNLENNKPVAILKRSTAYTVGAVAYTTAAPSWVRLVCTQAGTTASSMPSAYGTISAVGTVISDGTTKFVVYDIRPSDTLSSSTYQIPSMNLVNDFDSQLAINGVRFYFDYHDGKYGYNTDSSRDISTFVAF